MILEGPAEQDGIAEEVTVAPHLGPGGVDAERDDRQKDIDDPDAEIFRSSSRKADPVKPTRVCRRLYRSD
jgi:hypothetical protein